MIVLGIARGHDAGVCLVKDGLVLCVVEAERVLNIKHADGPGTIASSAAVAFASTGITPSSVDRVVIADTYRDDIEKHYPHLVECIHGPKLVAKIGTANALNHIHGSDLGITGMKLDTPVYFACHHAAHAALAIYMSGFDSGLVYVYDGYGMCCGTLGYHYKDHLLQRIEESRDRILVGWRYQSLAYMIKEIDKSQTKSYDFAGKLMGLCSYGKPNSSYSDGLKNWLRDGFDEYSKCWDPSIPRLKTIENPEGYTLNSTSADDVNFKTMLASVQQAVNDVVCEEIGPLLKATGESKIALAGGCALNIIANDHIARINGVSELFVPPNASDAGLPMGAAIIGAAMDGIPLHFPDIPLAVKRSPYKGPRLLNWTDDGNFTVSPPAALDQSAKSIALDTIVNSLASGGVVGFIKGEMEIGPRALGHRSLFADATNGDMREILNVRIKRREWWRPFAPVARSLDAQEYFEIDYECPYMLRSVIVKESWRERLSSITHIDNSARLQVIGREADHPELWYILTELKRLTGIGVCLNTSLNLGGRPIMNNWDEVKSFIDNTSVDYIYVDGTLYYRNNEKSS